MQNTGLCADLGLLLLLLEEQPPGEKKKKRYVLMIAPDYNLVLYLQVSGFVQVHNGAVECFPAVPQCTLLNNREIIYWRE